MSLEEELFGVERSFWFGGEEAFLQNIDVRCLLAFPQAGQMHGIYTREQIARSVATQPDRWRDLRIANRHLLELGDEAAAISYRADVLRSDGQPYAALVSSVYLRRDDGWKLAAHQHSPVE